MRENLLGFSAGWVIDPYFFEHNSENAVIGFLFFFQDSLENTDTRRFQPIRRDVPSKNDETMALPAKFPRLVLSRNGDQNWPCLQRYPESKAYENRSQGRNA